MLFFFKVIFLKTNKQKTKISTKKTKQTKIFTNSKILYAFTDLTQDIKYKTLYLEA